MRTTFAFTTDLGANNKKIVISTTSEAGDTASAPFTVYYGVTDPLGAVIANVATLVGSLANLSTITASYLLTFTADGKYIPGDYTLEVRVLNGGGSYLSRTATFKWEPDVVEDSSDVQSTSSVINIETTSSCEARTLCLRDNTDYTGWTILSQLFGVTAPATAAVPNPVEATISGRFNWCFDAPIDGNYSWRSLVQRSKSTVSAGTIQFTYTQLEALAIVGTYPLDCNAICAAVTCLSGTYDHLSAEACGSSWSAVDAAALANALKQTMQVVLLLGADKCGDLSLVEKYKTVAATDCGCGCSGS